MCLIFLEVTFLDLQPFILYLFRNLRFIFKKFFYCLRYVLDIFSLSLINLLKKIKDYFL